MFQTCTDHRCGKIPARPPPWWAKEVGSGRARVCPRPRWPRPSTKRRGNCGSGPRKCRRPDNKNVFFCRSYS